jgi:hexosaminidase
LATAVSLPVCRMFCGEDVGTIWPRPTGNVKITNDVIRINVDEISFKTESFKKAPAYWSMAESRFLEMQSKKKPKNIKVEKGGKLLTIEIQSESDDMGKNFKIKV